MTITQMKQALERRGSNLYLDLIDFRENDCRPWFGWRLIGSDVELPLIGSDVELPLMRRRLDWADLPLLLRREQVSKGVQKMMDSVLKNDGLCTKE